MLPTIGIASGCGDHPAPAWSSAASASSVTVDVPEDGQCRMVVRVEPGLRSRCLGPLRDQCTENNRRWCASKLDRSSGDLENHHPHGQPRRSHRLRESPTAPRCCESQLAGLRCRVATIIEDLNDDLTQDTADAPDVAWKGCWATTGPPANTGDINLPTAPADGGGCGNLAADRQWWKSLAHTDPDSDRRAQPPRIPGERHRQPVVDLPRTTPVREVERWDRAIPRRPREEPRCANHGYQLGAGRHRQIGQTEGLVDGAYTGARCPRSRCDRRSCWP